MFCLDCTAKLLTIIFVTGIRHRQVLTIIRFLIFIYFQVLNLEFYHSLTYQTALQMVDSSSHVHVSHLAFLFTLHTIDKVKYKQCFINFMKIRSAVPIYSTNSGKNG